MGIYGMAGAAGNDLERRPFAGIVDGQHSGGYGSYRNLYPEELPRPAAETTLVAAGKRLRDIDPCTRGTHQARLPAIVIALHQCRLPVGRVMPRFRIHS